MSGEFRPEQHPHGIESTADPDLARHFGLTSFNRETGLYTAPTAPDAAQRDGADVQAERHAAAKAEGDEQDKAERERLAAAGVGQGGPGQDVTESDERTPGAPTKAAKAAASKASQSKTDDKGDDKK